MIQNQVINYLLQSKDTSFLLMNNINSDFFSDYKNEFNYIKNHINTYNNIPDQISFLNEFPDFDIIKVEESPKYLLDELYNDRNKRKLAKTFNKVRDLINQNKIEEATTLYTSAADDMISARHLESVDILKDTSRYDKYVEKCNDFGKYYVKTGFAELDKAIGGWDRNEELATIVARPGVGKSFALIKTAIAAAEQGLTVGIYSGEMSETKVGYRVDTLISHISNGALIHGDERVMNDYKNFLDNLSNTIKGTIKVLTPAMIDGPAGVTALRAFIEKDKLDMLCVDQHSLLEDDRKARSPVEKAANISRDLKNLQVLKKIPIISVSQQNRESTEAGVSTSHVAQSDRISQDSTVIIFLERAENILTLNLVKSRDSVNGSKLKYAIDLNKGIFEYIPDTEDLLEGESCDELKAEYDYSGEEEVF